MKRWYVVNTKPKKESHVEKIFREASFDVYNPQYKFEKRIRPFFPGYVFLKYDDDQPFRLVGYTRGVKKVVGNRSGPIALPDEIIDGIRSREKDGLIELEKFGETPAEGDEIEVVEGPLKGLRGIFLKTVSDRERVMILMNYVSYQGTLLIELGKLKKTLPH